MTDKPVDNDPASINNSKHHTANYLEEQYQNNPDNFSPYNPDNTGVYPGEEEGDRYEPINKDKIDEYPDVA